MFANFCYVEVLVEAPGMLDVTSGLIHEFAMLKHQRGSPCKRRIGHVIVGFFICIKFNVLVIWNMLYNLMSEYNC